MPFWRAYISIYRLQSSHSTVTPYLQHLADACMCEPVALSICNRYKLSLVVRAVTLTQQTAPFYTENKKLFHLSWNCMILLKILYFLQLYFFLGIVLFWCFLCALIKKKWNPKLQLKYRRFSCSGCWEMYIYNILWAVQAGDARRKHLGIQTNYQKSNSGPIIMQKLGEVNIPTRRVFFLEAAVQDIICCLP